MSENTSPLLVAVMTPPEIATELIKYVADLNGMEDTPAAKKLNEQITSAIPDIAGVLMNETGHNFKHYKTSTLMRRIQRRMQILKLSSVQDVSPLDDDKSDVVQIMQRIVLDEFAPQSVVVDEEGQLEHVSLLPDSNA